MIFITIVRISEDMHSPYSFHITSDHSPSWRVRICVLLCYSYHGLGDYGCRACLCFCLFLVGNSLCNQTLTLIDSNSRKTATEIQERTNGKDQVGEQLFTAELDLSKGTKQAVKSGQSEHPGWDLALGG